MGREEGDEVSNRAQELDFLHCSPPIPAQIGATAESQRARTLFSVSFGEETSTPSCRLFSCESGKLYVDWRSLTQSPLASLEKRIEIRNRVREKEPMRNKSGLGPIRVA